MPEIFDQNPLTRSKYEGEAEKKQKYAKLGRRITDNVPHKLFGLKTTDEEYWGLREILTEPEVDIALTMKQRKWYTYDELFAKNQKMGKEAFSKSLDLLCVHGFVEYDYGDHYDDNGPIPGAPKEKRYRTSYFVPVLRSCAAPGSASQAGLQSRRLLRSAGDPDGGAGTHRGLPLPELRAQRRRSQQVHWLRPVYDSLRV